MIYAYAVIVILVATMGFITVKAAGELFDLQIENKYLREIIEQNEIQIGMMEAQAQRDRVDRRVIGKHISKTIKEEESGGVSRYN